MFFVKTIKEVKTIGKNNSPVIFDISYTPYRLKKNATQEEIAKHASERAFYDMTGDNNIYRYMTTDGKVFGNEADKYTMLEYLQKSTGVFNQNGLLSKEEVKEIKERAQDKGKCLWHGFISFNEEDSKLIDTPDKCIDVIRKTFNQFFKDAGFDPDNMDLMCSLHLDRPKHLHIHYLFFEKEPKIKNKRAVGYIYRKKGKISFDAIEKMTERLNAYTLNDELEEKRKAVIEKLSDVSRGFIDARNRDSLRDDMLKLSEELPQHKALYYASREIEPYRKKIDGIAFRMMLISPVFAKACFEFEREVDKKKWQLADKMGAWYKRKAEEETSCVQYKEGYTEGVDGVRCLHTIEALKWDYRRRIGNVVLKRIQEMRGNLYVKNSMIKKPRKTNDKAMKRSIRISERYMGGWFDKMLSGVVGEFETHAIACNNRLREICEEIEEKHKEEQARAQYEEEVRIAKEEARRAKYNWSK